MPSCDTVCVQHDEGREETILGRAEQHCEQLTQNKIVLSILTECSLQTCIGTTLSTTSTSMQKVLPVRRLSSLISPSLAILTLSVSNSKVELPLPPLPPLGLALGGGLIL